MQHFSALAFTTAIGTTVTVIVCCILSSLIIMTMLNSRRSSVDWSGSKNARQWIATISVLFVACAHYLRIYYNLSIHVDLGGKRLFIGIDDWI